MTESSTATLTLEFNFPAELSSPLPTTEVVECYFHVLGETTIKADIAKAMLPLFLHGYQSGDYRLTTAAFGPLLTDGVSFLWPWFDEWLDRFRTHHLLPERWEVFADQVKNRRGRIKHERVPLLADTVCRMAHNRRLANQHAGTVPHPVSGRKKVYTYTLRSGCEASQSIAAECLQRLVPGDWRTYPPFFPGDRTSVEREGKWI